MEKTSPSPMPVKETRFEAKKRIQSEKVYLNTFWYLKHQQYLCRERMPSWGVVLGFQRSTRELSAFTKERTTDSE